MIETLGEALNLGWNVKAQCQRPSKVGMAKVGRCFWSAELDLLTLVVTRGRAFPLDQLASRLRCPRCGFRSVRVMLVSAPGERRAFMGL